MEKLFHRFIGIEKEDEKGNKKYADSVEMEKGTIYNKKESEEEKELDEDKIVDAIKKLKLGKASGIDGIPLKIWRYGGIEARRWLVDLLTRTM